MWTGSPSSTATRQVPQAPVSHDDATSTPLARSTSMTVTPAGTSRLSAERASSTVNALESSMSVGLAKYSKWTVSSLRPAAAAMRRVASSIGPGPHT